MDFRNWFGDDNTKTILETTGTGAAFCDFDGDGFLDLYIVNGAVVFDSPRYRDLSRETQPQAGGTPRNGLFLNNGDGTFTEGAVAAGVGYSGWGQGCACADYDNDGDQDLYITYYGANVLYRNGGDNTFAEVGAAAGVDSDRYSTAMAFADYDGDGLVDLFVGNYVDFDPQTAVLPGKVPGVRPGAFPPRPRQRLLPASQTCCTKTAGTALLPRRAPQPGSTKCWARLWARSFSTTTTTATRTYSWPTTQWQTFCTPTMEAGSSARMP